MINSADNEYKIYRRPKKERISGAIWSIFMILLGAIMLVLPAAAGQPITGRQVFFVIVVFILVGMAFGYLMLGTQLRTTSDHIEYRGFFTKKKVGWEQLESVAINSYGLLLVWHKVAPNSESESAYAKRKTKMIPLHHFVKGWWEIGAWEQHTLGYDIKTHAPRIFTELRNVLQTELNTDS